MTYMVVNLGRCLSLFLSNLLDDSSQRSILFACQRCQWSVGVDKNIVFREIFKETFLLQVRMEFNLIDNRFVFRNLENSFDIDNPEI